MASMFSDSERAALDWRWLFVKRALRKRCPQCGEGPLFRAFARLNPECPACGLRFRREHGSQTGAMYLSATLTEIFAAGVALALFFLTDLDKSTALGLGIAVVVVFSYTLLPITMAVWTAVEYATDVSNSEPWTVPRR
jgi:uncharacterized protein (DUF983 family)